MKPRSAIIRLRAAQLIALATFVPAADADSIRHVFESGPVKGNFINGSSHGSSGGFYNGEFLYGYSIVSAAPKFDPAAGVLNSITFSYDASLAMEATYFFNNNFNFENKPGNIFHSVTLDLELADPERSQTYFAHSENVSGQVAVPHFSSATGNLLMETEESETIFALDILSLFTGSSENIDLNALAFQRFNYTGTFAEGGPAAPDLNLSFAISYDFTPIPEPGPLLLAAVGAALLLLFRERFRLRIPR